MTYISSIMFSIAVEKCSGCLCCLVSVPALSRCTCSYQLPGVCPCLEPLHALLSVAWRLSLPWTAACALIRCLASVPALSRCTRSYQLPGVCPCLEPLHAPLSVEDVGPPAFSRCTRSYSLEGAATPPPAFSCCTRSYQLRARPPSAFSCCWRSYQLRARPSRWQPSYRPMSGNASGNGLPVTFTHTRNNE